MNPGTEHDETLVPRLKDLVPCWHTTDYRMALRQTGNDLAEAAELLRFKAIGTFRDFR